MGPCFVRRNTIKSDRIEPPSRRSMDRIVPSEGTDAGSIPAERTRAKRVPWLESNRRLPIFLYPKDLEKRSPLGPQASKRRRRFREQQSERRFLPRGQRLVGLKQGTQGFARFYALYRLSEGVAS